MGLFSKKTCSVCGGGIGLFGNRKLEDGNLCKNCAAKLSPWFRERRSSTVEQIRAQLRYREENKSAVAAFHTTSSFGEDTKLLLDEDARKFVVTEASNLISDNPDVLDFSQVTGVNLDVEEDASEAETEDKDGKSVSYNPPRYDYSYERNRNFILKRLFDILLSLLFLTVLSPLMATLAILIHAEDGAYVWMVGENNLPVKRPVEPGPSTSTYQTVLSGLEEGEEIWSASGVLEPLLEAVGALFGKDRASALEFLLDGGEMAACGEGIDEALLDDPEDACVEAGSVSLPLHRLFSALDPLEAAVSAADAAGGGRIQETTLTPYWANFPSPVTTVRSLARAVAMMILSAGSLWKSGNCAARIMIPSVGGMAASPYCSLRSATNTATSLGMKTLFSFMRRAISQVDMDE